MRLLGGQTRKKSDARYTFAIVRTTVIGFRDNAGNTGQGMGEAAETDDVCAVLASDDVLSPAPAYTGSSLQ